MKNQRSRFHLITFFLLCAFLAAVVFCARHAGLVSFTVPEIVETAVHDEPAENQAGDSSSSEESLIHPEPVPTDDNVSPSDNDLFDTTGL